MLGLIRALARSRAVRPLLAWVLAVFVYVISQPPQGWVLMLVVGLGVALAMTVARLREGRREVTERAARAWQLAERLAGAVEDRIRGDQQPHAAPVPLPGQQAGYGPADGVYGYLNDPRPVYDPAALLSAVVALLAAEGLPVNAAPALPVAAGLLANHGIMAHPGAPSATAWGLAEAMRPAPVMRPVRAVSPSLMASVIRAVLTRDQVMPQIISTDAAAELIADTADVLAALGLHPAEDGGGLANWPVITEIIDAAAARAR